MSEKKERKEFDDMWDIPKLYISACSNSVQLVPLHPIIISILFQHYKELKECMSEVEQIITDANSSRANDCSRSNKKLDWLTIKEEEEDTGEEEQQKIELPATLDGYFIHNNTNYK
jgi:hypothetical protein